MDPLSRAMLEMLMGGVRGQPGGAMSFTTAEKVNRYTNKELLVADDKQFLATFARYNKPDKNWVTFFKHSRTATTGFQSSGPKVDLTPENCISIADLKLSIDRPIHGKYFLCRTIMPPHKMTSIMTVVDDPDGTLAVRLALYNFTHATQNLEKVLPIGIILAIKSPWFKSTADGGLTVRVDNPGDVVMMTDKEMSKLHPNLCWKGEIPQEYLSRAITYTKAKPEDKIPETDHKFLEFKNLGNTSFVEKQYVDAIRYYSQALDIDGEDLDILANRAAAFNNLRCYRKAMEDLTLVLKLDSTHVKGIYRMVKSLWGLQKYAEALDLLQTKFMEANNTRKLKRNKDLKQMKNTAEILLQQSKTGEFDVVELLKVSDGKESIDVAEFFGPVPMTPEVADKKGRGLVAREDIKPGQLLICSKAYAFHVLEKTEDQFQISVNYANNAIGCLNSPGK